MTDQNPQPDPAKTQERPQLVGLARARQLIAAAEHVTTPGAPGVALISGMVSHANAIAAISLAESARLEALVAVMTHRSGDDFTTGEVMGIQAQIRALVGVPAIKPTEES